MVFEGIAKHGISFLSPELKLQLKSVLKSQIEWINSMEREEGTLPSFRAIQMNFHHEGIRFVNLFLI